MRLLLDSCVWGGVRAALAAANHDVEWVGAWAEDPGDEQILARAHTARRILVTLDRDFGELAVVRGAPHSGIIRLVNLAARDQAPACQRALEMHGTLLEGGAIITVEPGRIRVRPGNE